jgi:hypothetical protein
LAAFLPPLGLTGGAPAAPGGRGGGRSPVAASAPAATAPQPQPAGRTARAPVIDSAPVPPAPIPNAGAQPGQRTNSFLDKIFGSL